MRDEFIKIAGCPDREPGQKAIQARKDIFAFRRISNEEKNALLTPCVKGSKTAEILELDVRVVRHYNCCLFFFVFIFYSNKSKEVSSGWIITVKMEPVNCFLLTRQYLFSFLWDKSIPLHSLHLILYKLLWKFPNANANFIYCNFIYTYPYSYYCY